MSLILCGMPGSGKTEVRKVLAKRLGLPFVDTDALIEKRYLEREREGLSCTEIYRKKGECFFRELERETVLSLSLLPPLVVATGGGTLENEESCAHLRQGGVIVYLAAPPDLLWKRLQERGGRIPAYLNPNAAKKSFFALFAKREPLYLKAAHFVIEVGSLTVHEVAEGVVKECCCTKGII